MLFSTRVHERPILSFAEAGRHLVTASAPLTSSVHRRTDKARP